MAFRNTIKVSNSFDADPDLAKDVLIHMFRILIGKCSRTLHMSNTVLYQVRHVHRPVLACRNKKNVISDGVM